MNHPKPLPAPTKTPHVFRRKKSLESSFENDFHDPRLFANLFSEKVLIPGDTVNSPLDSFQLHDLIKATHADFEKRRRNQWISDVTSEGMVNFDCANGVRVTMAIKIFANGLVDMAIPAEESSAKPKLTKKEREAESMKVRERLRGVGLN